MRQMVRSTGFSVSLDSSKNREKKKNDGLKEYGYNRDNEQRRMKRNKVPVMPYSIKIP